MAGAIYKTEDRGRIWQNIINNNYHIFDINFLTIYIGWYFDRSQNYLSIYQTKDAGHIFHIYREYKNIYEEYYYEFKDAQKFVFLDEANCYILGSSAIYRSTDSCVTFTKMSSPDLIFRDFYFLDKNTGYAVSDLAQVYQYKSIP